MLDWLSKLKIKPNNNPYLLDDKEIANIRKYIDNNNLFNSERLLFKFENKLVAKYSFVNQFINIPNNFSTNLENKHNFDLLKKDFGDNTALFIVTHEIGHAIHHQSLDLTPISYIKINPDFDKFLNRPINNRTAIDDFLHMNFAEGYADCYSGLVSYLKNDDKQLINDIFQFRRRMYAEIKSDKSFFIDNTIAPKLGKLSVTEYANYHAVESFKNNFIDVFSKEDILEMVQNNGFGLIHKFIQLEVIKGLKDTLVNEININPLFAREFDDFCKNKKTTITDYLNDFTQYIKEEEINLLKEVVKSDLSKNQAVEKFVQELKTSTINYVPSNTLSSFFNEEDKINLNSLITYEKYSDAGIKASIISKIAGNKVYNSFFKEVKDNNLSELTIEVKGMISQNKFNWIENKANQKDGLQLESIKILSNEEILNDYIKSLDNEGCENFKKDQKKYNITKLSLVSVFHESTNNVVAKEMVNKNILNMREKFINNSLDKSKEFKI